MTKSSSKAVELFMAWQFHVVCNCCVIRWVWGWLLAAIRWIIRCAATPQCRAATHWRQHIFLVLWNRRMCAKWHGKIFDYRIFLVSVLGTSTAGASSSCIDSKYMTYVGRKILTWTCFKALMHMCAAEVFHRIWMSTCENSAATTRELRLWSLIWIFGARMLRAFITSSVFMGRNLT